MLFGGRSFNISAKIDPQNISAILRYTYASVHAQLIEMYLTDTKGKCYAHWGLIMFVFDHYICVIESYLYVSPCQLTFYIMIFHKHKIFPWEVWCSAPLISFYSHATALLLVHVHMPIYHPQWEPTWFLECPTLLSFQLLGLCTGLCILAIHIIIHTSSY